MAVRPAHLESNPLSRLADAVPREAALAVSIAAKLLGAALALWYAYDQDTLFPSEHFPRTWAFVTVIAVMALLSAIPASYRGSAFVSAFGAGVLVFGGANLAQKGAGVGVLVCGVVAWLAVAAWNHRRGESIGSSVSGLFMGSLATFLAVAAIVLTVEN